MALTKCNMPKDVIGSLGTNPSERGLTTQQFKDKFDEMPEGIIDYLNNTLTVELDPVVGKVATLSNKNILHNWDFRNPVNQRGQTTYTTTSTSGIYTIDRWLLSASDAGQQAALTVNDGHITLSSANSRPILRQITEITVKEDTVLTFSVNITEISGAATMMLRDTAFAIYATKSDISAPGMCSITGTVPAGKTILLQMNTNASEQSFSISKAKLEPGPVSTLASDPPADYGEELRKCQRYYVAFGGNDANEKFGVGVYSSSTQFLLTIPLKVEMRANPTVTATGNFILGGAAITGVSITNDGSTAKTGSLLVQGFSGRTPGQSAWLSANNDLNARIVFSAEL